MEKASTWLPDERAEPARLSAANGPVRAARREYGRQVLAVRPVNLVRSEAGAKTPNLIYRHGSISDCSGILRRRYSGKRGRR